MRKKLLWPVLLLAFSPVFFSLQSCEEITLEDTLTVLDSILQGSDESVLFGWNEGNENYDELESDINLSSSSNTGSMPTQTDISEYYPPIGNQGAYGTCVTWSVGYNFRSFLDAYNGEYSPTSTTEQYSPKDLFWAIDNGMKGDDCNGTSFEAALDLLVSRGVADMETVPYDNLGDCSSNPPASWTDNANNHKIENYRKVGEQGNIDVQKLKEYLANGRPVVIGAKLGDKFMQWNDNNVLSSDTYLEPGMQHAYHAMILSGYDDNRGLNGAFRVRNSWSRSWGDDGSIWVDYDFFAEEFCFAAFVGKNVQDNPDDDGDNAVDDDKIRKGYDIQAWNLQDTDDPEEDDARWRKIVYNAFNSGDKTIAAEEDWSILYLWYDAYDANNYGILVNDYYSDDYGSRGEDGNFEDVGASGPGTVNWYNYIDVPSGQSVAYALYGDDAKNDNFLWYYYTPEELNGKYYFVLIADGFDVIKEANEENNYIFFQQDNGDPIEVEDGIIDDSGVTAKAMSKSKPSKTGASEYATPVDANHVNTYKPSEIMTKLRNDIKTGEIQEKVKEYQKRMKAAKRKLK